MATDLRLANLKDIPAIRQTGALLTLAATIAAGIALFFLVPVAEQSTFVLRAR